jgi:hypothetical protein
MEIIYYFDGYNVTDVQLILLELPHISINVNLRVQHRDLCIFSRNINREHVAGGI